MPTVAATKYGIVGSNFGSSWTTARQTGNFATNQPSTTNSTALMVNRVNGKDGINYRITRAFLAFDLSAYAGQTITNLTLSFRQTTGTVAGGLGIAILKSTAQGSGSTFNNLTASDFYSTIDFSTSYADFVPYISSSNSNNVQPLTQAAMVDASSGSLRLVMVQGSNDNLNVTPTSDGTENGNWNTATSSSGFIPVLSFVATDWGEEINNVPLVSIEKINGVPRNTIDAVNILESTAAGAYFFYVADFFGSSSTWTKVWTSVNPPSDAAVGDILYTSDSLTTPIGANTDLAVGQYGPNGCTNLPTVIDTNSSGAITAIGCAPV